MDTIVGRVPHVIVAAPCARLTAVRFVALLRGVNVGRHKRMRMAELRDALVAAGLDEVSTYLQSGNVLFSAETDDRSTLESSIEAAVGERFGFDVAVLVRSAEQMQEVVVSNPYAPQAASDPTRVHAMFLAASPSAEAWSRVDPASVAPDEFSVNDDVVYMHLPNGMGGAQLPDAIVQAELGVAATTRNWRTVTRLLEMLTVLASQH